jgi:hypothetical protein
VHDEAYQRSVQDFYQFFRQAEFRSYLQQQRIRQAYGLGGPPFSSFSPITIAPYDPYSSAALAQSIQFGTSVATVATPALNAVPVTAQASVSQSRPPAIF